VGGPGTSNQNVITFVQLLLDLIQLPLGSVFVTLCIILDFTELLPFYRFTEKFLNIYRKKIFVELFTELMPSKHPIKVNKGANEG